MKFELSFDSGYKGRLRDALKTKLSAFLWLTFIGILVIFVAFYVIFFNYSRVITAVDRLLGFALLACGLTLMVAAPFVAIFKGFNRGITGEMRFLFEKKRDEKDWKYVLTAVRNGLPFDEYGTVSLIDMKTRVAEVKTVKGTVYYIPLKEISDDARRNLGFVEGDVRALRIAETAGKFCNVRLRPYSERSFFMCRKIRKKLKFRCFLSDMIDKACFCDKILEKCSRMCYNTIECG